MSTPPKKIRLAINGYGRIGRCVHRQALTSDTFEVVAINSRSDAATHAHLLKYDSIYGTIPNEISTDVTDIVIDGARVKTFTGVPGVDFDWRSTGVDVVIESTGKSTTYPDAERHLTAGAAKVVITAPCKDIRVPTLVCGVNDDHDYSPTDRIVSNASCTTNCLAPVAKVLHEAFGIAAATMTTVHSVTNDQRIHDNSHKDLRRARSFLPSIIPAKTGVSSALARVYPEVASKFSGIALRVPTLTVSCVDLVATLKRDVTAEEVNTAFKKAEAGRLKNILGVSDLPLVSSDFRGDARSCIVDSAITKVTAGRLVKVLAWYDNEWGYSARVLDLARLVSR